ncbi:DNA polymerase gamma [Microthyrium microscopicum]|uniref:DNA-directed DNA polymerase n=1 Tax=Microthyrium microscopicum TaxID=703497 RepID=A0A6A6UG59_9PEZI|nr:DNA polymerase gamma [Microthyrium microscopicum]
MHHYQRTRLVARLARQHKAILDLRLPIAPLLRYEQSRSYAASAEATEAAEAHTLARSSNARFNEIGVQHLSDHVHSQIFPPNPPKPPQELIDLSRDHLTRHDLLGKNLDTTPPVAFDLPQLQGRTLDEHFYRLAMDSAETYFENAKRFARANPPQRPRKWVKKSGWTKYNADGTTESVDAPQETELTFDTEVMYKETSFACMACACSPTAWYSWLSPWLLGESKSDRHLIPMGDPKKQRIIIGHNIGYDRARISEEYSLEHSNNFFLDTMSLHVAVNGMCSRQRPTWVKHRKSRELRDEISKSENSTELALLLESGKLTDEEEDLWVGRSSVNSLRDVAQFHCGVTIDKAKREYFGELDRKGVVEKLDELLDYCAADVDITHRVYRKVFPAYLETCPHPVSFAALRFLSTEILPVNKGWEAYIKNTEATYMKLSDGVQERILKLCDKALKLRNKPVKYQDDPWLSQLDWTGQEIKMVKGEKKDDPMRPAKRQKMPGMPQWYKDLHATSDSEINLTVRTRITPLLLRLSWRGYPLTWSDVHGYMYKVPNEEVQQLRQQGLERSDMDEEKNEKLRDDRTHCYFKLPHKDGPTARCTNPLAKGYLQYFEQGTLSSEYSYAKAALEMNASCSYWISARDRIKSQMVVYNDEVKDPEAKKRRTKASVAYILPQVIPMGTITRRAVENTWLTASNAKANRVGSELKSMVTAPPGYCFVGADVDSEELWIASLMGDAQFKLHGGNAIGFMTLEGTKAAGTDLHSRTAKILGISRNDAKIFNYGRIYGAGQKFATQLLRQFNPNTAESDALKTAQNLYAETKGKKTTRKSLRTRSFWRGGTESFVFNRLEDFAQQEFPKTPVLGAGITEALQQRYISKGGFLTSRINWAIQSSGVDYLHLLIVAMDYLTRRYALNARLSLTVHDEIRYLVKSEDRYRAALALQIANVWTRAMFSQQLGIGDLPQACAYFSAVDIDHVLRKEVDMDCVTPSHPTAIKPGESLDIAELLAKGHEAQLNPNAPGAQTSDLSRFDYTPREPIIASLERDTDTAYLRAQITADDAELRQIIKEATGGEDTKPPSSGSSGRGRPRKVSTGEGKKPRSPRVKKDNMADAAMNIHYHHQQTPNLVPVDETLWGNTASTWMNKNWEGKKNLWQVGLGTYRGPKPAITGTRW